MARYVHKEPIRADEDLEIAAVQAAVPHITNARSAQSFIRLVHPQIIDNFVFQYLANKLAGVKTP
jgi:hypothetical protein